MLLSLFIALRVRQFPTEDASFLRRETRQRANWLGNPPSFPGLTSRF